MGIATAIFQFLAGLMQGIPYFNKWFTKPTETKVEDAKATIQAEDAEAQKTGRPGK
jgi:hypothetical protein